MFRWRQKSQDDLVTLACISYIFSAVLALLSIPDGALAITMGPALILGGLNGVFFFLAFIFMMPLLASKGAAISSAVSRLTILIPIFSSIIFWNASPSILQYAGIGSACIALVMIGKKGDQIRDSEPSFRGFISIALFFLTAGITRLCLEAFGQYCRTEETFIYVLSTFCVAGLISILVLAIRFRLPTKKELLFGSLVGAANNLQVYFFLLALGIFPGFVIFPVTSVGGLLFTASFAVLIMKEKLNRFYYYGIGFAVLSLLLLQY